MAQGSHLHDQRGCHLKHPEARLGLWPNLDWAFCCPSPGRSSHWPKLPAQTYSFVRHCNSRSTRYYGHNQTLIPANVVDPCSRPRGKRTHERGQVYQSLLVSRFDSAPRQSRHNGKSQISLSNCLYFYRTLSSKSYSSSAQTQTQTWCTTQLRLCKDPKLSNDWIRNLPACLIYL